MNLNLEFSRLTTSIPAIEAIDADDRIVRTPVGIWICRRLHAITVLDSTIPKTGKWNQVHLNAVNAA